MFTRTIVVMIFFSASTYSLGKEPATDKMESLSHLLPTSFVPPATSRKINSLPANSIVQVMPSNARIPLYVRGHYAFEYYPNNYNAAEGFWAYKDFECQSLGLPNHVLFLVQSRSPDASMPWIYHVSGNIIGKPSDAHECARARLGPAGNFCDSRGERCINHYILSACLVRRDAIATLRSQGYGPTIDQYDRELRPPNLDRNNKIAKFICSLK